MTTGTITNARELREAAGKSSSDQLGEGVEAFSLKKVEDLPISRRHLQTSSA